MSTIYNVGKEAITDGAIGAVTGAGLGLTAPVALWNSDHGVLAALSIPFAGAMGAIGGIGGGILGSMYGGIEGWEKTRGERIPISGEEYHGNR